MTSGKDEKWLNVAGVTPLRVKGKRRVLMGENKKLVAFDPGKVIKHLDDVMLILDQPGLKRDIPTAVFQILDRIKEIVRRGITIPDVSKIMRAWEQTLWQQLPSVEMYPHDPACPCEICTFIKLRDALCNGQQGGE